MFDLQVKAGNQDLLLMLILQFMFLSDGRFRLSIAQFPSSLCTATDLFHILWVC